MPEYDLAGNPLPEKNTGQNAPLGGPPPAQRPPYAPPPQQSMPSQSAPVRYDMAGNPLPAAAAPPPGAAPVGSWPPPANRYQQAQENTSGMKGDVPPEIANLKWNWGAFGLSWIWGFGNQVTGLAVAVLLLPLLGFIPFVNFVSPFVSLGLIIYLGLNGHKLAWQNRRFEGGVSQFMDVQRAWSNWGIGLFVVWFLMIPILAAILFPVFAQARAKAEAMHGGSYSAPPGNYGNFRSPTAGGGQ